MKAIQIISQDLFDKIRSRFQNLEMGDVDGGVTIDPAEARFFDFDFVLEGVNLGRVSINIADPGRLKIYYSQGITEDQDDDVKKLWYKFLKEMRFFAMRRLLRFDTRDISKSNLDKNDFKYLAANSPKDENKMSTMNESRWNHKTTSKTSRAVKGRTEVIVRHTGPMNEMLPSSRSDRRNIKSIFVQNKEGERWKCPLNDVKLAFGIAQHVEHGGVPHDKIGTKIIEMAQELEQIKEFVKHLKPSQLNSDPLGIREKAIGRYNNLKATLESLSKRKFYEQWTSEQVEQEDDSMLELDQVAFESYKDALTQTTFNETLTDFFPLIHKIMKEANKVDLEEYVSEKTTNDTITQEETNLTPEDEFKIWAESIEEGRPNIQRIQSELPTIPLGPDGSTAWESILDMLGIATDERLTADVMSDPRYQDLQDRLKNAANAGESDKEGVAYDRFMNWLKDQNTQTADPLYPDIYQTLVPQEAPVPTTPAPADQEMPTQEPVDQKMNEGSNEDWIHEVAKIVKSRFNLSNESVGPFVSETGLILDVKKEIKEKFNDEKLAEKACTVAEKYINLLTSKWEKEHQKSVDDLGPQPSVQDSLDRLKELVVHLKDKMETIPDIKADEGMLDKVKQIGKRVLDKVAPDDATLLKNLEKDSGGRIPPQFEPKPEVKSESIQDILKLSGLKK